MKKVLTLIFILIFAAAFTLEQIFRNNIYQFAELMTETHEKRGIRKAISVEFNGLRLHNNEVVLAYSVTYEYWTTRNGKPSKTNFYQEHNLLYHSLRFNNSKYNSMGFDGFGHIDFLELPPEVSLDDEIFPEKNPCDKEMNNEGGKKLDAGDEKR